MIAGLDAAGLVLLLLAAFAAGWVDAVSGGGGLVQVPALLIALPGQPVVVALGTNKVAAVMGTSAAAVTYTRHRAPELGTAVPMAVAAVIGSAAGASAASWVPAAWLRPVVLVLLVAAWAWTLLQPSLGTRDDLRWAGRRRHYLAATAAGLGIGAYDGLLGPGTGSLLVVILVAGLGYSFLRASATAKIVNVGTNLAALAVFAVTGSVLWPLGLAMGVANLAGGVAGARAALARGSGFVRLVFLTVGAVLVARLGWDLLTA